MSPKIMGITETIIKRDVVYQVHLKHEGKIQLSVRFCQTDFADAVGCMNDLIKDFNNAKRDLKNDWSKSDFAFVKVETTYKEVAI